MPAPHGDYISLNGESGNFHVPLLLQMNLATADSPSRKAVFGSQIELQYQKKQDCSEVSDLKVGQGFCSAGVFLFLPILYRGPVSIVGGLLLDNPNSHNH